MAELLDGGDKAVFEKEPGLLPGTRVKEEGQAVQVLDNVGCLEVVHELGAIVVCHDALEEVGCVEGGIDLKALVSNKPPKECPGLRVAVVVMAFVVGAASARRTLAFALAPAPAPAPAPAVAVATTSACATTATATAAAAGLLELAVLMGIWGLLGPIAGSMSMALLPSSSG